MASRSGQSPSDPYNMSIDDEGKIMPENLSELIPGRTDHPAHILTEAMLYLKSPPEVPKYWGQHNPNFNYYHSDNIESCSTLWIPDTENWLLQEEEMRSRYTDHSNAACNAISVIPHGVGVEDGFSLW